ncbi:hypothetical protein I2486_21545 [Cellulophaga sp. E16_2]|uniref:hypothetical protein n=1 Tax=Cellulophaga sp. E16_2 TaxID=2789297 RepID=UPI001A911515|nr:hypothetical protein [Cellulophaga sp. E16_2]MBO0593993.1 hypothetical protein [Cellulophaga sp. E16_2]
MKYEKVHTVNDYWDGPIEGVADFQGKPHKFKLLFDENEDDYSTDYELQKISVKEFDLILQSWSLWIKWNNKDDKTKEEFDSHPVLPTDKEKREKIEAQLKGLTESNDSNKFKIKGYFNRLGSEHHDFEVHWKVNEDV